MSLKNTAYKRTNGRCAYCGRPVELKKANLDVLMRSVFDGDGTINTADPLIVCPTCKAMKGSLTLENFRDKISHLTQELSENPTYSEAIWFGKIQELPASSEFYFEKEESRVDASAEEMTSEKAAEVLRSAILYSGGGYTTGQTEKALAMALASLTAPSPPKPLLHKGYRVKMNGKYPVTEYQKGKIFTVNSEPRFIAGQMRVNLYGLSEYPVDGLELESEGDDTNDKGSTGSYSHNPAADLSAGLGDPQKAETHDP